MASPLAVRLLLSNPCPPHSSRAWIKEDVWQDKSVDAESNLKELSRRLLKCENLPTFAAMQVDVAMLCREGERLENEQQMILDNKLSEDYFDPSKAMPASA